MGPKDKNSQVASDFLNGPSSVEVAMIRSMCWGSQEVLSELKGLPWDDFALQIVHSLRPSAIRVSQGMFNADSMPWRVSVEIDSNNIILLIKQEVVYQSSEKYKNGYEIKKELKRRRSI